MGNTSEKNSFKTHWRERAEMDSTDDRLLGEDECGDLWVPSRTMDQWWDRRFSPRNPTHWRYWLRSRRLLRLAMIERLVSDV